MEKTRSRAGPAKWLPCRCRDARQNQKRRRASSRSPGFEHGDGDVVQVTKAHRPVARGVMAGRAHEAENVFAVARGFQRIQRRGDGGAGKRDDVFVKRCVSVKILRFVQAGECRAECARRIVASSTPVGAAQTMGNSFWLRKKSSVPVMRAGRSGWPSRA